MFILWGSYLQVKDNFPCVYHQSLASLLLKAYQQCHFLTWEISKNSKIPRIRKHNYRLLGPAETLKIIDSICQILSKIQEILLICLLCFPTTPFQQSPSFTLLQQLVVKEAMICSSLSDVSLPKKGDPQILSLRAPLCTILGHIWPWIVPDVTDTLIQKEF